MKLYQIPEKRQELLATIEEATEFDESMFDDLESLDEQFNSSIEWLLEGRQNTLGRVDELNAELVRLTNMRNGLLKQVGSTEQFIGKLMDRSDREEVLPVKFKKVTVKDFDVAKYDDTFIPDEFKRIVVKRTGIKTIPKGTRKKLQEAGVLFYEVDKSAVKAAVKAGVKVAGFTMWPERRVTIDGKGQKLL